MSDAHNITSTSTSTSTDMLTIEGLRAWYGESCALQGVDLRVARGGVTTLIGRNGAGKTTTLRSVMGLVSRREGAIRFEGVDTLRMAPDAVARLGIGYCPEERGIFSSLSVEENLRLLPIVRPGGMSLDRIHALFPNLLERRKAPGGRLSGGEQQMLAIGRILRTGAQLLLLDEPTEGLAPVVVGQIAHAIRVLKESGFTLLLVEQNFDFALSVSDHFHVMENGRVVDAVAAEHVLSGDGKARLHAYLSV